MTDGAQRGQVRVVLPRALVELFPSADIETAMDARSVDEVMNTLDARWPGMRDRLVDSRPAIRRHINVFVDGRRVTLDTVLAPGASVHVMTAISGG